MTVELLDTETESRQGNSEAEEEEDDDEEGKQDQHQLEQYVARFLGPGEQNVNSLCPNTMVHLARKPVFLSRSVRSYRAKTRHKIVPRPIAKEKEEKKEEPVPVLPLPAAPPNRQGKLNLSDSTIMWEEADTGGCIINNDFKILWVVNSENYIYKKNALNIAKKVRSILFLEYSETNCLEYLKEHLFKSYSLLPLSDAPSSVSTKVQGDEQLALKLGRPARLGGRPVPPQRLDARQGRRPPHQQNPSSHPLRPQQNSLPDVHKIPSG